MSSKRYSPNPRVKLHKNGHVTVSGLTTHTLKALLTAADLYRYSELQKPGMVRDSEPYVYHTQQLAFNAHIKARVDDEIDKTFPWHNQPPTVEQRREAVMQERNLLLLIDRVFEEHVAEKRAAIQRLVNLLRWVERYSRLRAFGLSDLMARAYLGAKFRPFDKNIAFRCGESTYEP